MFWCEALRVHEPHFMEPRRYLPSGPLVSSKLVPKNGFPGSVEGRSSLPFLPMRRRRFLKNNHTTAGTLLNLQKESGGGSHSREWPREPLPNKQPPHPPTATWGPRLCRPERGMPCRCCFLAHIGATGGERFSPPSLTKIAPPQHFFNEIAGVETSSRPHIYILKHGAPCRPRHHRSIVLAKQESTRKIMLRYSP